MQDAPIDLNKLTAALSDEGLRIVLVGGMAVIYHGGSFLTVDVDLAIAFDRENVAKLVRALAPLHPRPLRLATGAQWVWDELCIRPPWSIFMTDAGRLDLIVRLPGVESFSGLYERSITTSLWGTNIHVASLDDLIAMKSASDREKDGVHLQALREIKALQSEQSGL
jgi:hypothetical protein